MTLKEKGVKFYNKLKNKFLKNDKLELIKKNIIEFRKNKFPNFKFDKKFKIIIGGALVVFIIFTCALTTKINSKDHMIKKINAVLEKRNTKGLSKLLVVDNVKKELSAEDVKPISEFYSNNKARIVDLTKAFNENQSIYSMSLKEEDAIIGQKYKIVTSYRELTINTDIEGANLYINGVSQGVINGKEKKVNLIAPGIYKIKVEYKGSDADLVKEKEITLTENESINIPLDGIKVTLRTNYPEAKVLINEVDSNIKAKDFKEKGPFPTDGSYKIAIKYNTPWGDVVSEPVEIKNNPEINLDLELKNEALKEQLTNLMEDFYNSVFSALNKENKDEIKGTTEEVKNKIYQILNEKYFILKNIYKLEAVDVDLNKSKITFENGQYVGNIVTSVDYLIKKDMFGIPLQSRSVNQSFFIEVIYKNGGWVISNVENFALEK